MNISRFLLWSFGGLLIVSLGLFFWMSLDLGGRPVKELGLSKSGRFEVGYVEANNIIFPFMGVYFLSVKDKEVPGRVYRSPLFDGCGVDLRFLDLGALVGVFSVYFNTDSKCYEIRDDMFLGGITNFLISNECYSVYVE